MNWWGKVSIEQQAMARWEIGSLRFALKRQAKEWQLCYEYLDEEPEAGQGIVHEVINRGELPEYSVVERYVFGSADEDLHILPATADRSIISRPIDSIIVPPGESAIIYVSTPLWVNIQVGKDAQMLQQLPLLRPSDTWFGPSTMVGELCYASRTSARLHLSETPILSYRATTQVHIRNSARSTLQVERLSLPVPYLALFQSENGRLWTETVNMVRDKDTGQAEVQIGRLPPVEATAAQKVAPSRQQSVGPLSLRAFGAILREARRWS